jgi:hypothetical protein
MFVDISFASVNVKVSVALTAALTPVVPVTNNVLPVTIVCVVEPSDIVKPVPVTLVLISLIAKTIEPFALVDKDDRSPTSVPNELKVVLKLSNV